MSITVKFTERSPWGRFVFWIACVWPLASVAAAGPAGYIDSAECAACHQQIARAYSATGMGRSFSLATAEAVAEAFDDAQPYYHPASDRYYSMHQRGGEYFIRRHQLGPDGAETNIVERRVDYVVGSGARSKTFLHRTGDGRLVELPVSWYSQNGGFWAISPGYDMADHLDFRRPITYQCMGCHNAYPDVEPDAYGRGRRSRFPQTLPQGIDCQRCHGPGQEHAAAAKGAAPPEAIRKAIVNPASLTPQRQMEVCLRCHLETTSSDLPHETWRYDRGVFSYLPGEPLENVTIHFDHAPGTGHEDKFQIVSSAYRLFKSQCFLQSQGALTCTTCHDPHAEPGGNKRGSATTPPAALATPLNSLNLPPREAT